MQGCEITQAEQLDRVQVERRIVPRHSRTLQNATDPRMACVLTRWCSFAAIEEPTLKELPYSELLFYLPWIFPASEGGIGGGQTGYDATQNWPINCQISGPVHPCHPLVESSWQHFDIRGRLGEEKVFGNSGRNPLSKRIRFGPNTNPNFPAGQDAMDVSQLLSLIYLFVGGQMEQLISDI